LTIILFILVEITSKLLATVNVGYIEKRQIMNNKLFTSISIKEQENTSGGAALYTVPDGSAIPIAPTSPQTLVYTRDLNDLLMQLLSRFGYNKPIPTSFSF